MQELSFGVYIGRFNPIHLGHQAVIANLLSKHGGNNLILIGSCNTPQSMRHYFGYKERRDFIQTVFQTVNIAGLPDYHTDEEWFTALYDIIRLRHSDLDTVEFFGGCEEDVTWLKDQGHSVSILNRFNGESPKISATEVRDALIHERSLKGMIDSRIQEPMRKLFKRKWAEFEKQ